MWAQLFKTVSSKFLVYYVKHNSSDCICCPTPFLVMAINFPREVHNVEAFTGDTGCCSSFSH